MGNKASLSANSMFPGALVWQSTAAAAQKEITGFHQSLSVGKNIGCTTHLFPCCILMSGVETLTGNV